MKVYVRLANGHTDTMPIPDGKSAEDVLNDFVAKKGGYESGWVRISNDHLVRYDQVLEIWIAG